MPVTPGGTERPNIPPPAPPRPKPAVNSADRLDETGRADAKASDAEVGAFQYVAAVDDQSAKKSPVVAPFDGAFGEASSASSVPEEKPSRTAELRTQWFQSNTLPKETPSKAADSVGPGNCATVRRTAVQTQIFDAEGGTAQPLSESRLPAAGATAAVDADRKISAQKALEVTVSVGSSSSSSSSSEVSAAQSVDRHVESSPSTLDSHSTKSPDIVANGDPRPKPMARSRPTPTQVQSGPVNHNNDETAPATTARPSLTSLSEGGSEAEVRKKSGAEVVDSKKTDFRPVSGVRRPPPPVIPRQTSRPTSDGSAGEGDGSKTMTSAVAAAPAAEDMYEEEDADTRL
jgi:hypothetical protein